MKTIVIIFFVIFSIPLPALAAINQVEVAGTIRGTAEKGWFVIENQTHTPLHIKDIKTGGKAIKITFDFKAETIHTFVATPDETFAIKGYFIGASVRPDHAILVIARSHEGKQVLVNPQKIDDILGNIWIYGLFSVEEN